MCRRSLKAADTIAWILRNAPKKGILRNSSAPSTTITNRSRQRRLKPTGVTTYEIVCDLSHDHVRGQRRPRTHS
jgi:hypothetical protein